MTAKQYLSRAYNLRRHIAQQEIHLEELRAQAEHITADLNGMPRGSGTSSPVERVAIQIADMSWELEKEWLDLLYYQEEIRKTIDLLPDPIASQILSLRYVSYRSWRQIADDTHYSMRQVYRIHAKGLRLVDDVIVWQ